MVTLIISKYHLENRITSRETKRIQDLYFTPLFLFIYFFKHLVFVSTQCHTFTTVISKNMSDSKHIKLMTPFICLLNLLYRS